MNPDHNLNAQSVRRNVGKTHGHRSILGSLLYLAMKRPLDIFIDANISVLYVSSLTDVYMKETKQVLWYFHWKHNFSYNYGLGKAINLKYTWM